MAGVWGSRGRVAWRKVGGACGPYSPGPGRRDYPEPKGQLGKVLSR